MGKVKILVVSDYTNYHSVRPEAEIFLSLRKRGYDITIMTYDGSQYSDKFKAAGIKVINHHPTKRYQRSSILAIRQELKVGNYDVIHLYNNKSIINGLIAAKWFKVKTIGYRGSTLNFSWYNIFNYFKHLSPSLDYVICNSQGVYDKYLEHPFFKSEKAIMINKGHDTDWYSEIQSINLHKKYNIANETPIFILVAKDRTMKGVKYLCQAINLLPESSDFRFFLIGGGMDAKKYSDILMRGKHIDKVHIQSHNPDALRYVAGADVFVLPSIKGESITKAVLEAMSLGKCPIITDISGNTELVHDKVNGLVVNSADPQALATAMQKVMINPKIIKKYGTASKQKIQDDLNHEDTVTAYERLYEGI